MQELLHAPLTLHHNFEYFGRLAKSWYPHAWKIAKMPFRKAWDLESCTSIQDPNDWLRDDNWTETSLSLTRHIRLLKPLRIDHPSSRACIHCNSFVTSCHMHWQVSNASINKLRRKDGALADNLHGLGGPCSGLFPRLPPDRQ